MHRIFDPFFTTKTKPRNGQHKGTGLGLSSISPWPHQGVTVATFTVLAAIWLIIVQWVSAIFGGYMAGRLRTKWVGVHTDEVFFRDTAHGFLAWALGTLIVAAMLSMAAAGAAGTGTQAAVTLAANTSQKTYFVDELFRQNANPAAATNGAAERGARNPKRFQPGHARRSRGDSGGGSGEWRREPD